MHFQIVFIKPIIIGFQYFQLIRSRKWTLHWVNTMMSMSKSHKLHFDLCWWLKNVAQTVLTNETNNRKGSKTNVVASQMNRFIWFIQSSQRRHGVNWPKSIEKWHCISIFLPVVWFIRRFILVSHPHFLLKSKCCLAIHDHKRECDCNECGNDNEDDDNDNNNCL